MDEEALDKLMMGGAVCDLIQTNVPLNVGLKGSCALQNKV